MRIGFPRALMIYRYYPFLSTFILECGHDAILSPPTNAQILGKGTDLCVDDVCVAVKVFFGHVSFLEDRVDAVLIPRLVTVEKQAHDTFTCPKLIAAPDMVRYSFPRLPQLLEFTVDISKAPWWWGCVRLGRQLNVPMRRIARAYKAAAREQKRFDGILHRGLLPADALDGFDNGNGITLPSYLSQGDVSVAIVGHPYLLGDQAVNKRLVHWLEADSARVLGSTMLSEEILESESSALPAISWSYERELLAATSYFFKQGDVDGVIYLTSFGCGPDSLMTEIARRELNPSGRKALLELVLDEHGAESGIRTRAEAFVDLLRYRKGNRANGKEAV